MNAIATNSDESCYFVDGPAGTGKTFLYNTLVHNLQAQGIKVNVWHIQELPAPCS